MSVKVGLKYIEIWKESMEDQVCAYEQEECIEDQIVFYGPSNFTRWGRKYDHKPLREVILGKSGAKCAVNRGFGSSCAEHQLYYYPRLIRPLKPRVLVYCSFGNASAFGYTWEENWFLAQRVVAYAKTDFPGIRVYLCGASRHREMTEEKMREALNYDRMIKEYVEKTPDCTYIDVMGYEPLNREDIYVEDGVHYNQTGYDIYADLFREALKDELAKY